VSDAIPGVSQKRPTKLDMTAELDVRDLIILTLKAQAASPRLSSLRAWKKWVGARNPVRIGSSCAAVTGYDFPLGQSPKPFPGVKAGTRYDASQAS
jgi:hypothetical protein